MIVRFRPALLTKLLLFSGITTTSRSMIPANIVIVSRELDTFLPALEKLPKEANILYKGTVKEDFESDAAKEAISSANILFTFGVGKELLAHLIPLMPKLKWIQCGAAGVDKILCKEIVESDIVLTNAKGAYSYTLAEHVILSILYFTKSVDRWKKNQNEKVWDQFNVHESRSKTLGIIGYGDIGRESARMAKALGMRIIALRRKVAESNDDPLLDEVYGPDKLGDVIEKSDFVCICTPLTPSTYKLIGKAEIARAKPHTVFINVGRGPVVDEKALVEALQNKAIRGAALDVFEVEPLPKDSPLWEMDNVLLSPHNTDFSFDYWKHCMTIFIEDVKNFIKGEPFKGHIVDKKSGY